MKEKALQWKVVMVRGARCLQTVLLLLAVGWVAHGQNGGVGGGAVSLPGGPGSFEGLGESFQPSMCTGMGSHSYPLTVPIGTAGMAPQFSLSYQRGGGNSILGLGWGMGLGAIQRRTDKGIPRYVDGPNGIDDDLDGVVDNIQEEDIFIESSGEDLVPVLEGGVTNYFAKIESNFTRFRRLGDYWESVSQSGNRNIYGQTEEARIVDPDNPTHVFEWLLEKEIDTHGNTIEFHYASFPGTGNLNDKFLVEVRYGAGTGPWQNFHFVRFQYEDRPDWFEDCRSGFVVRSGKRLIQADVGTQGPALTNHAHGDFNQDGVTDYLNRRYLVGYDPDSYRTLLKSITLVGADGVSSYPPTTYSYTSGTTATDLSAAGLAIGSLNEPFSTFENPLVDLIDLNGDGLPDLLRTEPGAGGHTAFINAGQRGDGVGGIQWNSGEPMGAGPDGLAWNSDLASGDAHLADVDGDGLVDLVRVVFDGAYFYRSIPGTQPSTVGWAEQARIAAQDFPPPTPYEDHDARVADINFDKHMDIIKSIRVGDGAAYQIWYNLGAEKYSPRITVIPDTGFLLSAPGVKVIDFNGDRVPDIARIRPSGVTVTAGLGYGRFSLPVFVPLPDGAFLSDDQIAHADLEDINGDGLVDLVVQRPEPGMLWFWLNRGNYTFEARRTVRGLPAAVGTLSFRWADMNGNGTVDLVVADSATIPHLQVFDFGQIFGSVPRPNLLTEIRNGLGEVTRMEYRTSTDYLLRDGTDGDGNYHYTWPHSMPFPVEVVSRETVSDSLGNTMESRFVYHDAYYDPVEKQFRGFGRAEKIAVGDTNCPTLVTRYEFDVGATELALKGRLLSISSETEDGRSFGQSTQDWSLHLFRTGLNGMVSRWVAPSRGRTQLTELGVGTPREILTEYTYDEFGHETQVHSWGIVEGTNTLAGNDERIIQNSFVYNTNAWLIGFPLRSEVRDGTGTLIAASEHFYDDETFSGTNRGFISLGDVTLVRRLRDTAVAEGFILSERHRYDAYGNVLAEFDPLADPAHPEKGHSREYQFDALFHAYPVAEIQHIGGGHPDLRLTSAHDYGLGVTLWMTDANGQTTRNGYDSFGRTIWEVDPGDTDAFPTKEFSYGEALPVEGGGWVSFTETRRLHRTPGSIPNAPKAAYYHVGRSYLDGLGRTRLQKAQADPDTTTGASRYVASGLVQFNARGGASVHLQSYYSTNFDFEDIRSPNWSGNFHLNGQYVVRGLAAAPAVTFDYDALGRERHVLQPDGSVSETRYEPLLTHGFDENATDPGSPYYGKHTTHHYDGLKRVTEIDEINPLTDEGRPSFTFSTWTTRYQYRADGALIAITDSQGNRKSMQYDALMRLVSQNDWDRGITRQTFDDASNLLEREDAKGQHIQFVYDGANRKISEDFVDDGSTEFSYRMHPDILYEYDVAAQPVGQGDGTTLPQRNTLGRVVHVRDTQGDEYASYDERGRIEWNVRSLRDLVHRQPVAYRTLMEYDSMNRVVRMVYPDDDFITYEYGDRTLLRRIRGGPNGTILADRTYTPTGQTESMTYGNGVRSSYSFDSRLRLTALSTGGPGTGLDGLLSYRYTLDPSSNIREIDDLRPSSIVADGDMRRNTQIFQYDSLYRLTGYQISHASPGTPQRDDGHISYRYDRIGNLLEQSSNLEQSERGWSVTDLGTLNYGGGLGPRNRVGRTTPDGGPHAMTQLVHGTSVRDFSYDANGNMNRMGGLASLTWDFVDRLVGYRDDQSQADYRYDYLGRRVSKEVSPVSGSSASPESTLYVSKGFEIRPHDVVVKHVFAGSKRVAQISGQLNATNRLHRLRLRAGWNLTALPVGVTNLLPSVGTSGDATLVWNSISREFQPLSVTDVSPVGSVLWIHAPQAGTVALRGSVAWDEPPSIPMGGGYLPLIGPSEVNSQTVIAPGMSYWRFEPNQKVWDIHLSLGTGTDPPRTQFGPGEALFLSSSNAFALPSGLFQPRIRYYHEDHLGSASVITDEHGALVEESTYYPFGALRTHFQVGSDTVAYGFDGKERDAESGLHYFEARYLSAVLGRFVSVDPLDRTDSPQSLNRYAYVNNRPILFDDPTGMKPRGANKAMQTHLTEQYKSSKEWKSDVDRVDPKSGKEFTVVEFSKKELKQKEVIVKGGKLVYKNKWFNNKVHTGGQRGMWGVAASKDVFIFVQDTKGRMFVARGDCGKIHHSSFVQKNASGNKEVWMAGEIMVDKGVIRGVNNQSGHFKPEFSYLEDFRDHLKSVGANLDKAAFATTTFHGGLAGNHESDTRFSQSRSRSSSQASPGDFNLAPAYQGHNDYERTPVSEGSNYNNVTVEEDEEPHYNTEEEPNYNTEDEPAYNSEG